MKQTVISMLKNAADQFGNRAYLLDKSDTGWDQVSFSRAYSDARQLAAGFLSKGITGQVSIMAEGRSEWVLCELALILSGSVSVPLSLRLTAEELPFRINHSESSAIVMSKITLPKALTIWQKLEKKPVLILLDDNKDVLDNTVSSCGLTRGRDLFTFSDLMNAGKEVLPQREKELDSIEENVSEDHTVTICYTSGTTGNPKGIMLSHKNYYTNCKDSVETFEVPYNFSTLVFLPIDHSFAHTVGIYAALMRGISLYFVDARKGGASIIRNIPINLPQANPKFLLTVPAITANFMKKMRQAVEKKGGIINAVFQAGVNAGVKRFGDGHNTPGLWVQVKTFFPYIIAKLLIFNKMKKIFGKNILYCVGGGALLDVKQQEFFNAIGVPIYQGYGLTEASPVISANTPKEHKFGSSGKVMPSVECRIVTDSSPEHGPEGPKSAPVGVKGEIVILGGNVMKGYFKNSKETENTIINGWLYTGDLGYMDKDGFLVVVGREKALLISSDGEKYSPEEIEEAIMTVSPLISQCMLYCDHKNSVTALIVPDKQACKEAFRKSDINTIDAALEKLNKEFRAFREDPSFKGKFPSHWLPGTFQVLEEEFTLENNMLNSTSKMVRYKITENYKDLLEYMYTEEGRNYLNTENRRALHNLFLNELSE
ncbi:MAG: AMP-dependent synthetase/ligase [Spirochaetia bacterium]